jgi:tRNA-splicing ligase RtcB
VADLEIPVFGRHDQNTLAQLADVASRAQRAALMADGHLGYIMPIGGVVAYRGKVSVAGVGFDIACGNAAIRTDLTLDRLADLSGIADAVAGAVSFGVGRKNLAFDAPTEDPLFTDPAWDAIPGKHERDTLRAKARAQIGTVGSGNHYVDVFVDESGSIWVGVHFGSRGFGHTIASGFMALAQNRRWNERGKDAEALLDLSSPLGDAYWSLMSLAGRYAYVGREWVARKVVSILGGRELELVHNHHNFAWKEMVDGETMVVVRKGATPAYPGQLGFVGGSMGDNAVILAGASSRQVEPLQRRALYSTVHGAGRVMSRTEAAGKRHRFGPRAGQPILNPDGSPKQPGKVSRQMMDDWVREKGVILRGAGVDESPHVYRRLPEVLAEQGETIEVVHTLRPLIVVMASSEEHDPYKD